MGIDVVGVQGAGRDAYALAQRLRTARSEWDGATRDGQSACGLPVVREAFHMLRDAWFTEVGAHATVLEQLCAALHESAVTYQHTDAAAASPWRRRAVASDDYGQLTTVLRRLGELGSLLNPVTLVATVAELIHEVTVPPPGDPGELEKLAGAFQAAAGAIEPVAEQVRALGNHQLPELWGGLAGGTAAQVVTATADVVGSTPATFNDAASALDTLAAQVRDQQRRHADLHQRLYDAYHDATHLAGLPIPNPFTLDNLVHAVGELISGARRVYTDAMSAADTAAAVFSELTGRARTAAGVEGGLGATDAVVLAGQQVSISGFDDRYDDAVLTPTQLTRAGQRLDAMSPAERADAEALLKRAGSPAERAYLLEAIAAGHSGTALTGFADKIRSKEPEWLHSHLNLIDRGGSGVHERFGARIDQYDDYTCGTTSLIVTRAEADPLYALTFTEGIENIDDKNMRRAEFEHRLSAEQAQVHDETNVLYPQFIGTSQIGMADWMNRHAEATGTTYGYHLVDDTDQREVSATPTLSTSKRLSCRSADLGQRSRSITGL